MPIRYRLSADNRCTSSRQ